MFKGFIAVLILVSFHDVLAQDRCGTVAYEKIRQLKNPSRETTSQFEMWMQNKLIQKAMAAKSKDQSQRIQSGSYTVPVVVHVIYNAGDATPGVRTNISDAQILSQLPVINADFQRLNTDSTKTPAEFLGVTGKFPITFVMAKQDPNGQPTNGIVRVQGTQTSWDITDNYTFKALSYWPAEDYLNIWVVNLSGGLLGYTQLPVSNTLAGLADASNDRLTDGVVVDYQAYGTAQAVGGAGFNLLSRYNLGRTATHEIGHFFGLRHVWGDCSPFSCSCTDYVADTPPQDTNFNGQCPSGSQLDCSGKVMYSNYMNYTDDACMNIFSQGQVARMDVIINNSPRRASLLTSPGLTAPTPVANDAGIKQILSPDITACAGNVVPSLLIRNYGTNNIDSCRVQFSLNGTPTQTLTFKSLGLVPNAQTSVSFSGVPISFGTNYNFSFQILQTNGGADGNVANDTLSVSTKTPVVATLPLLQTFATWPANWRIVNPDGLITWQINSPPGSSSAMYMDFYNYDNYGTYDRLITPVLDLTAATTASISFDWAYALFSGGGNDRLRVLVSTTCDFNSSPTVIFDRTGNALATTSAVGTAFVPTSSQWSSIILSLDQFAGQKIQIAFEGINGYGNNMYVRNVAVLNYPVAAFAISQLITPSPVSCMNNVAPVIAIKNLGNIQINSFKASVSINGTSSSQQITGVQLPAGATQHVSLSSTAFNNGTNNLKITISNPNGVGSGAGTVDSLQTVVVINNSSDVIPLRQNFDQPFTPAWTTTSPTQGSIWYPAVTTSSKKLSLLFDAFTNTSIGEQAWLVSPVLDFTEATTASVFFQTSYAYRAPNSDSFQVLVSTDCGETFNKVIFSATGNAMADTISAASWKPKTDATWTTRFINLDSLAGKQNVRFAFVATTANGNNLYLDNIEFFVSDNQNPPDISGLYSVYGGINIPVKVTFNLPERQNVRLQMYDMMGHIFADEWMDDVLNQTYTVNSNTLAAGLYIVRIQTNAGISSTKVLIGF
ncbi:MAG: choice-of-anchor J domain-containing protein [Bacteroidetes bacterium]|nr:choice-of-anchor J domain-containing protein [Bacteroidota bacterium]MBS1541524.1 choice-of-anchor J domain-containing protein [Bacteroidota bacterium]